MMANRMVMSVSLTENQRSKIRSAFKKKSGVTIQLSKNQLLYPGSDKINLTQTQASAIHKNKLLGKGYRLTLTYNRLQENYKGGFLPLIFAGIGALASLMGGGAAIANSIIDYKDREKNLKEKIRHNKALESKGGQLKKKLKKNKKNKSAK